MGYICCGIAWYFMGCRATVIASHVLNLLIAVLAYSVYETINLNRYSQFAVGFVSLFSSLAFYVYVAEVADNTFRAFFMGLFMVVNFGVARKFWSMMAGGQLPLLYRFTVVLALFSAVSSIFLPQTPFSLALKGDPQKARRVFAWFRAGDSDAAECEQMLATAQNIAQRGDLAKKILSPSFAVGMAICFFLGICELFPCDPHIVFAHERYATKNHTQALYVMANQFFYSIMAPQNQLDYILRGGLLYQVLCFVIPRKILYVGSITVNLLLSVPVVLQMDNELLKTITPYCFTSGYGGRFQSVFLLPVEVSCIFLSIGYLRRDRMRQLKQGSRGIQV